MNNIVAISLTPRAIKQIKTISKSIFPKFRRIRVSKKGVVLRKHLFAKGKKISITDFLLETLPKEMQKWALSMNLESPLPYYANSVKLLLYLEEINERNLIAYLWKCYSSIITAQTLQSEEIDYVDTKSVICTKIITNVMTERVLTNIKRLRNNLNNKVFVNPIQIIPFSVVYKSPDIRGSPKLHYLEERLIS